MIWFLALLLLPAAISKVKTSDTRMLHSANAMAKQQPYQSFSISLQWILLQFFTIVTTSVNQRNRHNSSCWCSRVPLDLNVFWWWRGWWYWWRWWWWWWPSDGLLMARYKTAPDAPGPSFPSFGLLRQRSFWSPSCSSAWSLSHLPPFENEPNRQ